MRLRPVLFITYSFPPDAAVGGRRIARFCHHLPHFGIRPVVLTVEPRFYEHLDESFQPLEGLQVYRTPVWPTPLDFYSRWVSRPTSRLPTAASGLLGKRSDSDALSKALKRHLLGLLRIPDDNCGWYFPALHVAERLIRKESIEAVVSTGPPWTDHMIARTLKKKYRLPWVADFRDAWTFDTWRSEFARMPRWRDLLDQRWETSCVQMADLVTAVSPDTREIFVRNHPNLPANKFVTITNGYDDVEELSPNAETKLGRLLLVHLGELYGDRRIDTFCAALVDLAHSDQLAMESFKLLFVGNSGEALVSAARRAAPTLFENNCIEFKPQVPWREARAIMSEADLLLIFQGSNRLALPAKFYDYLQSGKPILAVTVSGALSSMLEDTRSGLWADPSDSSGIRDKIIAALKLKPRSAEEVKQYTSQFHARNLTSRLASYLRQLIENGPFNDDHESE